MILNVYEKEKIEIKEKKIAKMKKKNDTTLITKRVEERE